MYLTIWPKWRTFVSLIIPFKFETTSLLLIHNSAGGLPSHSKTVLYAIYVLRYRTTVKLCNVFRWETLTLISSCGKTFHVKLSISSLTCWSTNQRRGWAYDKLFLIHGFKYWNSQELNSVNNTKSQQSGWEPTTLDWSKIIEYCLLYPLHQVGKISKVEKKFEIMYFITLQIENGTQMLLVITCTVVDHFPGHSLIHHAWYIHLMSQNQNQNPSQSHLRSMMAGSDLNMRSSPSTILPSK